MSVRDSKFRKLFDALAEADAAKARQEGTRLLLEIQEQMAALQADAKMVKSILARWGGAEDAMTSQDRSAKVRDAALTLVGQGNLELSAQAVIDFLRDKEGIVFDVKRPASMAGSVLSQMEEFERVAMNRFKFRGSGAAPRQEGEVERREPIDQPAENEG